MITSLRSLWKEAFGDTDEYIDIFFDTAFSPDRCRCAVDGESVAAALYLLDASYSGKRIAYIYAVATAEAYRGRGICRRLMEDAEEYMKRRGYVGAILVPGSPELFRMYEKMGYVTCSRINEFTVSASGSADICPREVSTDEYAQLRRELLPPGGVIEEDESLLLLGRTTKLYTSEGILFASHGEGDTLTVPELLGDAGKAKDIVSALGYKKGFFRTPGEGKAFAMYKGFTDDEMPTYFGIAFDL